MQVLLSFEHGGMIYNDAAKAIAAGADPVAVQAAQDAIDGIAKRDVIRGQIEREAGDVPSLLGTTSDAATIAILVGACFMASLDEKTSYSAFRAKANAYMQAISGDYDPTEIAQAFLAAVAAGDVRLPALEKGIVDVLAEVTKRSNAVAQAINPVAGA
jgi:hypothetical protein